MFRTVIQIAAVSLLLAGSARANVIYSFVQTSYGGPWAGQYNGPVIDVSFDLTNAAARASAFSERQFQWPFADLGSPGLIALSASAPTLAVGLGADEGLFQMDLTFGRKGRIVSSSFDFSNTQTDFTLFGSSRKAHGTYQTDHPGLCDQTGDCTFSGHWTRRHARPEPVPEPSSLPLIGVALMGLAVVRRGRAA